MCVCGCGCMPVCISNQVMMLFLLQIHSVTTHAVRFLMEHTRPLYWKAQPNQVCANTMTTP